MDLDNMSFDNTQEPMAMDSPTMDGSQEGTDNNMQDPSMTGGGNNAESQFDTNFDAGVEADEETDPKRYIQQLTGKLSTTLNSFNNDNGEPDEGLCKYVGKMIVKQAAKGLDDAGKKELIAAINTADSDTDEDLDGENDTIDNEADSTEDGENNNELMEYVITKKQVLKLSESLNQIAGDEDNVEKRDNVTQINKKQGQNTTFRGKVLR